MELFQYSDYLETNAIIVLLRTMYECTMHIKLD
jgi:hypothetical protein